MKRCFLLDHIAQTRYSIHKERSEMTKVQATAEVFITAFMHLPRPEREAFLLRLIRDPKLREELIDLAIVEKRKKEKTRDFDKVLAEIRKNG